MIDKHNDSHHNIPLIFFSLSIYKSLTINSSHKLINYS